MIGELVYGELPYSSAFETQRDICSPKGKNYTAGQVEDEARQKTNTVNNSDLTSAIFLDWINWGVGDIVLRKTLWPTYICWKFLGQGTSFDISNVKMRKIYKVVDSSIGLIKEVIPEDYERASTFINLYANSSAFCYQEGETLKIQYNSLAGGNVKMYYYRYPIFVHRRDEKPDLEDGYAFLLNNFIVQKVNDFLRSN